MRLLTHNALRNNAAAAKGKGFPLRITATEVEVKDSCPFDERRLVFVEGLLSTLDWSALIEAASQLGIPTLPPVLTEDLAEDPEFLEALHHVLMNVHLIQGILTCPATGREFPVRDGIPNMVLEEEDCEHVRY
jgi:multifunctional methyltransferase subunit TRM112